MTLQEINLKAKESLSKYFLNSTEVQHTSEVRKERSYDEIIAHINRDIQKETEHLNALHALKEKLEKDAKTVMQYYVHEEKVDQAVTHDTVESMREKLHDNTVAQMEYVSNLKQQAMR